MTDRPLLHHTADLPWIPLSTGISFKPIVFFPDDSGYQLLLRVAYLEWCEHTGTAPHLRPAGLSGVSR